MAISILGVIPARGNSQRLPRKNAMSVGGRTLIQRTADAINESLAFSSIGAQTVVSTDDPEIAEMAASAGLAVLSRPPELSAPDAMIWQVVKHAFNEAGPADALVVLLPTVPFRRGRHIDAALDALFDANHPEPPASALTVSQAEYPPEWMFKIDRRGRLNHIGDRSSPRSQLTPSYLHNGSVWAMRGDLVPSMKNNFGVGEYSVGVETPWEEAIDLDWPWQLEIAGTMAERMDEWRYAAERLPLG
jgi:CMP-N,N'-diacetyllegionaminic acid synthase